MLFRSILLIRDASCHLNSRINVEVKKLTNTRECSMNYAGLYKVEYSPTGGIKSKGLEMGKKIKSLKKRKKKIFEDLTLLAVPKGKM